MGAENPKIGLPNSSWANLSSNGVCYCYNNSEWLGTVSNEGLTNLRTVTEDGCVREGVSVVSGKRKRVRLNN